MRVAPALAAVLALLAVGCSSKPGGQGGTGGQPEPRCAADKECESEAGKPYCVLGSCVACRAAADCKVADTPACIEGVCKPCSGDNQCAAGLCNTGTGKCQECLDQDAQCADKPEAPHCDSKSGTCVQCLTRADCTKGGDCENSACVRACQRTPDCKLYPGSVCFSDGGAYGTCDAICNPESPACVEGRICQFLDGFDVMHHPVGACVEVPADNDSRPGEGGSCSQTEPCKAGLVCTGKAPLQFCSKICGGESDCGKGTSCQPAGAGGDIIHLCLGATCRHDADCAPNQTCSGTNGINGGNWVNVCEWSAGGTKLAGDHCTTNAECKSNACFAQLGTCGGACETAADCAQGASCINVNITDGTGNVGLGTICLAGCDSARDCGSAQSCVVFNDRNGLPKSMCWLQQTTGPRKGPGEACTDDADCAANLGGICQPQSFFRMESGSQGFCTGSCKDNSDCGGDTVCQPSLFQSAGPDNRTGTSDDVYIVINECLGKSCSVDGECTPPWVCAPTLDPTDPKHQGFTLRCAPPQGTTAGGGACGASWDCKTGLCFDPGVKQESCDNGIDDDGDGLVDCQDPDCHQVCGVEQDCFDGIDNDHDGAIDCADGDCFQVCHTESDCFDGIDNDHDGFTDCDDIDCRFSCNKFEFQCGDGIDNDGDGLTDCKDPDCRGFFECIEWDCSDGIDQDHNGYIDCADYFCVSTGQCPGQESSVPDCSDGIDNDGDGYIDCKDPSCWDTSNCLERNCATGNCCGDGLDNDGDGFADCFDTDCQSDPACNEIGKCKDGIDNDKDGFVDCDDSDCKTDPGCSETACAGGNCCKNGIDDDGDGGIDCVDNDCANDPACSEWACPNGNCCADGIDNDGNGLTDCQDPICKQNDFFRCRENFFCNDGIDNDGDGLIDCADPDCAGSSNCNVCFEACGAAADCETTGATCAKDAAVLQSPGPQHFDALDACLVEICTDGRDNDGDGLVDCKDPDCAAAPNCQ